VLFSAEKTPYSTDHAYFKSPKHYCEQLTYLVTLLWCLYVITDGYKILQICVEIVEYEHCGRVTGKIPAVFVTRHSLNTAIQPCHAHKMDRFSQNFFLNLLRNSIFIITWRVRSIFIEIRKYSAKNSKTSLEGIGTSLRFIHNKPGLLSQLSRGALDLKLILGN